jgi:hypothetical protein
MPRAIYRMLITFFACHAYTVTGLEVQLKCEAVLNRVKMHALSWDECDEVIRDAVCRHLFQILAGPATDIMPGEEVSLAPETDMGKAAKILDAFIPAGVEDKSHWHITLCQPHLEKVTTWLKSYRVSIQINALGVPYLLAPP